ncbi:MAG: hypothetical protein R2692_03980 [Microbacterium sp.]
MQEKAIEESLETDIPKARKPLSRAGLVWARLKKMPRFWIGITIVVAVILWAFVGPLLYPWSITDRDPLNLGMGPTMLHWFGTNSIGQDIYAQTLAGLQKSLIIGLVAGPTATVIAALVGSTAGYVAGGSTGSSSGSSRCCS